ncbi:hypothetical protein FP2506_02070 [Fulvimarina pelagi HTCC2506]|uniref:Integral membrane protein n=1 Tax=Fulvimarina pelagi HTCC2506 TaxID=314231 RepID=Q0FYK6_9HYPH|nr:DUF2270 domain-containing protein [Fulvimarina pelagi]EAU39989.1 hypothetical protein FP2506_02070 [Fulvimarina pelagi HTCC2506]
MQTGVQQKPMHAFDGGEMGAIAHLYRGEVYRSTIWRTRLDTTTNWSVVTLGIALSITFASPSASALPLLLVGILILFFLGLEARRYRYFNVWRARARWMETHFYVPVLRQDASIDEAEWTEVLAADYIRPRYHVSFFTAVGRRIRRNYLWILIIQSIAYIGKLIVHPTSIESFNHFVTRADIGPLPGEAVLIAGAFYVVTWTVIAIWSMRHDQRRARDRGSSSAMN